MASVLRWPATTSVSKRVFQIGILCAILILVTKVMPVLHDTKRYFSNCMHFLPILVILELIFCIKILYRHQIQYLKTLASAVTLHQFDFPSSIYSICMGWLHGCPSQVGSHVRTLFNSNTMGGIVWIYSLSYQKGVHDIAIPSSLKYLYVLLRTYLWTVVL